MIEVYCKRWFYKKNIWGITLYPFIFYNQKHWHIQEFMRKHEHVHIEQIKREGVFRFYIKYLWYHFTVGYDANPYEIEAIEKQYD